MALPFRETIWRSKKDGYIGYSYSVSVSLENRLDINTLLISFLVDEDTQVIELITTSQRVIVEDFHEKYGLPDQIYLKVFGVPGVSPSSYEIEFFYPAFGISVGLSGNSEFIEKNGEDYILVCHGMLHDAHVSTGMSFGPLQVKNHSWILFKILSMQWVFSR